MLVILNVEIQVAEIHGSHIRYNLHCNSSISGLEKAFTALTHVNTATCVLEHIQVPNLFRNWAIMIITL